LTAEQTEADITYAATHTTTNASVAVKGVLKKKPGKPKLSAKEKRERSVRFPSSFDLKRMRTLLAD
jgi:hypothetical protein